MRYRDFFKQKYFELNFKNIILFLFLLLFNGFSIGTITLLGPVRWIANLRDTLQFTQRTEDFLIKILIVLFVIVSFYISLLINSLLTKKKSILISTATMFTLVMITTGMLWLWMNPALIQAYDGVITQENVGQAEFLFGPYPTEHDLLRLKGEGITAVVSLLHPAVVPFEPKLLEDEKQITESIGLRLVHVPMLPWVSENKESINKIIELAESGKGKYYVHCYLGKDRVGVVKRIIRRFSSSITELNKDSIRTLESVTFFERGDIIKLEEGVYLTPYPTDDEMFTYLLNGSVKQVVSLLNPDHPPDTMWINKEKRIYETHFMPFEVIPLGTNLNSTKKLMEIVKKTKNMPRPLVIHAFRSKSSRTREFVRAYKLSLSEEPSSKFTKVKK
jgi:hypothetical protein